VNQSLLFAVPVTAPLVVAAALLAIRPLAEGVISDYDITEKTGLVAGIRVVSDSDDLLLITGDGQIIRTGVDNIRVCGRASQGVILMRSASEIIDITPVAREEAETPDAPAAADELEMSNE